MPKNTKKVTTPKVRRSAAADLECIKDFILESFDAGIERAQITIMIIQTAGILSRDYSVASLYRKVDQVLLNSGRRSKKGTTRVERGNGKGIADVPFVLREFQ